MSLLRFYFIYGISVPHGGSSFRFVRNLLSVFMD